jgi:hypothetical protein
MTVALRLNGNPDQPTPTLIPKLVGNAINLCLTILVNKFMHGVNKIIEKSS